MLVLTRKKNDSIVIDGRILVEILQVRGNGIRLGITAPPDVSIMRGELKPYGIAGTEEYPTHPPQEQQRLSFDDCTETEASDSGTLHSRTDFRLGKSVPPLPDHPRFTPSSNRWKIR
ncbi:MAG: carbon storage regulator [Planctomycetota bacterium]|nr:carbon storage regulator [Planctomycetota bacterium]MEC8389361.1 carbon storage regulator [Planctomycetota bacterium]